MKTKKIIETIPNAIQVVVHYLADSFGALWASVGIEAKPFS